MHDVFTVGDEPIPGYKLLEDVGGTAFYRMWKVSAPDGSTKLWKEIDLVVGNAAVETRLLSLLVQLRHPNINTLTNFWQLDNGETLVIETESPELTLRDRLQEVQRQGQPGIQPGELQKYFAEAAAGLDFLNTAQHEFEGQNVAIYHRALRPESLILFPSGNEKLCKVADFGLAKPVTEQSAQHSQGLMHYDYDPPEFFEGSTAQTSDQYALAINYYELRTGNLPFTGTMLEQLQARLNDEPELNALSGGEKDVVRKALSREPGNRFSGCVEFISSLHNAGGGGVSAPVSAAPPQQQAAPAPSPQQGFSAPPQAGPSSSPAPQQPFQPAQSPQPSFPQPMEPQQPATPLQQPTVPQPQPASAPQPSFPTPDQGMAAQAPQSPGGGGDQGGQIPGVVYNPRPQQPKPQSSLQDLRKELQESGRRGPQGGGGSSNLMPVIIIAAALIILAGVLLYLFGLK